jgi:lycopene cyclase domain-containing protein
MWAYLIGLCVSLAGLAVLDYRYKLTFWYNTRRTCWTIGTAVGVFVIWDILGILLGIFFHGGSLWTLPLRILPEFPIEELFFLSLLCYVTLLLYRRLEQA